MDFKKRALGLMFNGGKVRRNGKLKPRRETLKEIGVFQDKAKKLTSFYDKLLEDGYIYFDICYYSNVSPSEYRELFKTVV